MPTNAPVPAPSDLPARGEALSAERLQAFTAAVREFEYELHEDDTPEGFYHPDDPRWWRGDKSAKARQRVLDLFSEQAAAVATLTAALAEAERRADALDYLCDWVDGEDVLFRVSDTPDDWRTDHNEKPPAVVDVRHWADLDLYETASDALVRTRRENGDAPAIDAETHSEAEGELYYRAIHAADCEWRLSRWSSEAPCTCAAIPDPPARPETTDAEAHHGR